MMFTNTMEAPKSRKQMKACERVWSQGHAWFPILGYLITTNGDRTRASKERVLHGLFVSLLHFCLSKPFILQIFFGIYGSHHSWELSVPFRAQNFFPSVFCAASSHWEPWPCHGLCWVLRKKKWRVWGSFVEEFNENWCIMRCKQCEKLSSRRR